MFCTSAHRTLTRGHQIAAQSVSKVVEHTVAVALKHLCVDVEAGVAELCDFLGQQLHTVHGVAEDDGLVDAQLQGWKSNRGKKDIERKQNIKKRRWQSVQEMMDWLDTHWRLSNQSLF